LFVPSLERLVITNDLVGIIVRLFVYYPMYSFERAHGIFAITVANGTKTALDSEIPLS